jgi:hypothetical protein
MVRKSFELDAMIKGMPRKSTIDPDPELPLPWIRRYFSFGIDREERVLHR